MVIPPQQNVPHSATGGINRPVHLGRRDAFFERAVELLSQPLDSLSSDQRQQRVSQVVQVLRTAQRHTSFAITHADASSREQDFLRFLELKIETLRSAGTLIGHQVVLEEEEGFLCSFLQASPDEFRLPAMHFQRQAEDIIHGLWHILRLAQSPFHALRNEVQDGLDDSQRQRYDRAYRMARTEVEQQFPMVAPGHASTKRTH